MGTRTHQEPSKELAARFREVTAAAGATVGHTSIEVMMGRHLDVPLAGAACTRELVQARNGTIRTALLLLSSTDA